MRSWRKTTCGCRITGESAESGLAIAESGFLTARIIRLYDRMHAAGQRGEPWTIRRWFDRSRISALVDFLYTYGIGGSMTRQDQLTFARFHHMEGLAHRLTLVNSVVFGLPSALIYFAAGQGFELMAHLHSAAEVPSLIAADASFALALIHAVVDVFRIMDSWLGKRCWAPFGTLPLVLNLPTYLKTAARRAGIAGPDSDCDCSGLR
jgi:hypothetical protein